MVFQYALDQLRDMLTCVPTVQVLNLKNWRRYYRQLNTKFYTLWAFLSVYMVSIVTVRETHLLQEIRILGNPR